MPKEVTRFLALATLGLAGLTFAGCSKPEEKQGAAPGQTDQTPRFDSDKKHKVLLLVQQKKANAFPDRIVVKDYGKKPAQRITWHFVHKSTMFTFKGANLGVLNCKNDEGTCTLDLAKDLLPLGVDVKVFKYTIDGEDDSGKLDTNDPEIEIDR
ncbi:MAG TPA: hypothetical protein VGM13_07145 [Thermoanaerobaculia bacterium]